MEVIAALGDAPTAAIAVVAILLGVFFAARGPRDKRAAGAEGDAGDGDERAPMMIRVPVTAPADPPAPDVEPGFVGPEGTIVGHGRIRLGASGPLGARGAAPEPQAHTAPQAEPLPQAAPEPEPQPAPAPAAEPEPQPAAEPEPEPPASEPAFFASPPTIPEPLAGAVPLPAAAPAPAPDATPAPQPEPAAEESQPAAPPAEEPAGPREPAWRVAARAANSAVHFRQGTIKLGGEAVDKRDEE